MYGSTGKKSWPLCLLLLAACSGRPSPVGEAQLQIIKVPNQVRCIQVNVNSWPAVTSKFFVTPQQSSSLSVARVPAGNQTFTALAFNVSCSSVFATTVPSWSGGPVTANITGGGTTNVGLRMTRYVPSSGGPGTAQVNVDFDCPVQFVQNQNLLQVPRWGASGAVIGNSFYVVGGAAQQPLASVERALIQADGTLGEFATVPGVNLQTARSGHSMLVYNGFVYVVGGTVASGPAPAIERALIVNGELGAFVPLPTLGQLPPPADSAVIVEAPAAPQKWMYLLGAQAAAGVWRAEILPDGNLGAFMPVWGLLDGTPLDAAFQVGQQVYAVGDRILRAPILPDGQLGGFQPDWANPDWTPRGGFASALLADGLYVLGGDTGTNAPFPSVLRAAVTPGGLGHFERLPDAPDLKLTSKRVAAAAAGANGHLHVAGGYLLEGGDQLLGTSESTVDACSQ
jgi:hypothetical protein